MVAKTKQKQKHNDQAVADHIAVAMGLKMTKNKTSNNSEKVAKVFDWAKKELVKAEELLLKRKSTIILETAKKLEDLGIEKSKISTEISKNLKGFVSDRWVQEILKDNPEYKQEYRIKNARKNKSSRINSANSAQSEQSQNEEHRQEDDDDAPTGHYQMPPNEFRINDVEQYDRVFLIEVVRYLYGELQQRGWNQ